MEPQLINTVNLDSYVSRVLIEEVGYNVPDEYLKIQAIISRTYALRNLRRHKDDGFDLCNKVHCQVYHGKKEIPSSIHTATASTSGTVITDQKGEPILATFHANCGGKTANSEHVWNNPMPYLVSKIDTFCLNQRSADWNMELDLNQLKKIR
jgi:stage II sporulation protein D